MGDKIIRTGVYALLLDEDKMVTIKKGRGPFTGFYDLPGGKIDFGETVLEALERELGEELGLKKEEYAIQKLLSVEECFVKHVYKGEKKNEHLIGIVYLVNIKIDVLDLEYKEKDGDSLGTKIMRIFDKEHQKTEIFEKTLDTYLKNKV